MLLKRRKYIFQQKYRIVFAVSSEFYIDHISYISISNISKLNYRFEVHYISLGWLL